MLQRLAVFCGSSPGARDVYANAARELATLLVERGIGLVYGGGNTGIMGILANRVLEGGGEVVGVIPGALAEKELAHEGCTELHVVTSMHERKALMADLAGGFVALPGGIGTLEEICEVYTWAQLGFHGKPCGLLDVDGYWTALSRLLDHFVEERFMRGEHRDMLPSFSSPAALLDAYAAFKAPLVDKWLDRGET